MSATKDSAPLSSSSAKSHKAILSLERIAVVGAGGNGSVFLTHLCRIHQAWVKLGGQPFAIDVFDTDCVSEANLARQVFCEADIGLNKAVVLTERMKAFYGVDARAHGRFEGHNNYDIIVGCVDNLATRKQMMRESQPRKVPRTGNNHPGYEWGGCYWLDMGNTADAGQVVLGGHGLPNFFDLYPHMLKAKDSKSLPSCSMAESLQRQDLFVNSIIAGYAGQLLWKLMRTGSIDHHGYVINLSTGRTVPIPI